MEDVKLDVKVTWAGIFRSSLIGQIISDGGDQEGLIGGKVSWHRAKKISDRDQKKEYTVVNFIPSKFYCTKSEMGRFYDAKGNLKEAVVKKAVEIFQADGLQLLGAWKIRNNSRPALSSRDIVICKNLKYWMSRSRSIPYDCALFGIFGAEKSMQDSIHSYVTRFFVSSSRHELPKGIAAYTPNLFQSSQQEYDGFHDMRCGYNFDGELSDGSSPTVHPCERLLSLCLRKVDDKRRELDENTPDEDMIDVEDSPQI
mmetsp:Transcript_9258/g.13900  ORF Transcript_9258/g.13900 Transcript_9258/m.13900 type:complete len:256 (-) Transcript_9258:206-973(-)